jgi:hypothetical protein
MTRTLSLVRTVTCHRLIGCGLSNVREHVAELAGAEIASTATEWPRWFPHGAPRRAVVKGWREFGPGPHPGWPIDCCLEVEQGANGVLAHLSAMPASDQPWPLPGPVTDLVVRMWTARRLAKLANAVEAAREGREPALRQAGRSMVAGR